MDRPSVFRNVLLSAGLSAGAIIAAYFSQPLEGRKHYAYLDGANIWTICDGHTEGVKQGDVATDEQCDRYHAEDLKAAENAYDKAVHRKMPDNTQAAAIDLALNIGAGNFTRSSMPRLLNAGNRAAVCDRFLKFKYQGPVDCSLSANTKTCGGIWNRRRSERNLCLDDRHYSRFVVGPDNLIVGIP